MRIMPQRPANEMKTDFLFNKQRETIGRAAEESRETKSCWHRLSPSDRSCSNCSLATHVNAHALNHPCVINESSLSFLLLHYELAHKFTETRSKWSKIRWTQYSFYHIVVIVVVIVAKSIASMHNGTLWGWRTISKLLHCYSSDEATKNERRKKNKQQPTKRTITQCQPNKWINIYILKVLAAMRSKKSQVGCHLSLFFHFFFF